MKSISRLLMEIEGDYHGTVNFWTQPEAIEFCKKVETVCVEYGCHVALTGGLLYKDGPRKDCDILFYRIRQEPDINIQGLLDHLHQIGVKLESEHGWVKKAEYEGKGVDMFFPENFPDVCKFYGNRIMDRP